LQVFDKGYGSLSIEILRYGGGFVINKLTIEDVPENLKSIAFSIGIDAFRNLIKTAGGTSIYLPSERCITKGVRNRLIRESFCGDYKELALRFGISEVRVRKIVSGNS